MPVALAATAAARDGATSGGGITFVELDLASLAPARALWAKSEEMVGERF